MKKYLIMFTCGIILALTLLLTGISKTEDPTFSPWGSALMTGGVSAAIVLVAVGDIGMRREMKKPRTSGTVSGEAQTEDTP